MEIKDMNDSELLNEHLRAFGVMPKRTAAGWNLSPAEYFEGVRKALVEGEPYDEGPLPKGAVA